MGGNKIVIVIIALILAGATMIGFLGQSTAPTTSNTANTPIQSPEFAKNYNLPSLLGMWKFVPAPTLTAFPTLPIPPSPTSTTAPQPTPTNTNVHIPPPTGTQPTTPPVVAGACSAMDNELPNATMHYPNGSTTMPTTTREICAWNSGQYYSLPYRNPNCRASQKGIDEAMKRIPSFYNNLDRPTRLAADWRTVQDYAVKYNFNPLFVISLWIEESGASGVSYATKLGCDYRLNKNDTFTRLPANSSICEQMECLFGRRSVYPQNYASWACQYRYGAGAWNGSNCTNAVTHTKTVDFWYNEIGRHSNLSSDCWPKYFSGADSRC